MVEEADKKASKAYRSKVFLENRDFLDFVFNRMEFISITYRYLLFLSDAHFPFSKVLSYAY